MFSKSSLVMTESRCSIDSVAIISIKEYGQLLLESV